MHFGKVSIAALLLLVGCATKSKDYGYMSGADYQNRSTLTQSLINANEPMSEAAVQKILSSKIALPKKMNLAVVRLSESQQGLDFKMVDQEIAAKFYALENWGPRVQSVIPVPELLLPKPVTIAGLRQAAVLLQADELLVIKPSSYGDWRAEFFAANKAKGITSLEVLLLDTRTSVVPFTSIVTETAEISEEKADYSNHELENRAKKVSEAKALLKVAPAVRKFFASMP